MTLTITIPSELEAKLQSEAARQGLKTDEYLLRLLEDKLTSEIQEPFWKRATQEQWLKAFDNWMDGYDASLPPFSENDLSRESFYGERG
ncbi:MAG: hypothetical protein AB1757_05430 [Acidobacteriota bacterium]